MVAGIPVLNCHSCNGRLTGAHSAHQHWTSVEGCICPNTRHSACNDIAECAEPITSCGHVLDVTDPQSRQH